jgi:5'-nucleotidase
MAIILTNDDGIDAPGIKALQKAIDGMGIIVAPKNHQSGCGHQVTTVQPLEVQRRSPTEYAVDGTPADCTRIALTHFDRNCIKWVLSGVNAGGNLGIDAYISGTVAAVREAAIYGIPGIAISHWIRRPLLVDWDLVAKSSTRVLQKLFDRPLPDRCFWNVNLPHLTSDNPEPEIIFCEPSIDPLQVIYRIEGDLHYYQGEYAKRDRTPGTDVDVCFSGNIAVTLLKLGS